MRFIPPPKIWMLDEDPKTNAKYHSDKALRKDIRSSCSVLMGAYLYSGGLRTVKIAKAVLYKENKNEIDENERAKYFPGFDDVSGLNINPMYSSRRLLKWVTASEPNWKYLVSLFRAFLDEHYYRFKKESKYEKYYQSIALYPPKVSKSQSYRPLSSMFSKIPVQYRKGKLSDGIKFWFKKTIMDPFVEYSGEIPEWILPKDVFGF